VVSESRAVAVFDEFVRAPRAAMPFETRSSRTPAASPHVSRRPAMCRSPPWFGADPLQLKSDDRQVGATPTAPASQAG
jgi:hypothetical protein